MPVSIQALVADLDEGTIAERVGLAHDAARESFRLERITVRSYEEFVEEAAGYVIHHHGRCIAPGVRLRPDEAKGRVREMLDRHYHRQNGNIVTAFRDATAGTNGGMRGVLDILCDIMKEESIRRYVQVAFDRHVAPHAFADKVELMRQFLEHYGPVLGSAVLRDEPARYASNADELINAFCEALRRSAPAFRRL